MEKTTQRKALQGLVVSNKMNKTVVVQVERKYAHSKFKKVVKSVNIMRMMRKMNATLGTLSVLARRGR